MVLCAGLSLLAVPVDELIPKANCREGVCSLGDRTFLFMDAWENEVNMKHKDENDSYQPDYDNSFDFSQSLEEAIEEVTGGVPLQVRNLILFRFSMIDEYEGHELPSILCSLKNLQDEKRKK